MKRVLFVYLFFWAQLIQAQTYVTIPDPHFASYIKSRIPGAMSNGLLDISSPLTTGLQSVDLVNYGITNLDGIQYFTSLDTLIIGGNRITSSPALPASLQYLGIFNSPASAIPLPAGLKSLACINNSLTSLPILPSTLIELNCGYNLLTSLPALPPSLIHLDCGTNSLSSLPTLPNSLQSLICYDNSLTTLPALPIALTDLYCQINSLSTLPALPDSLQTLYCYSNSLTVLPSLPNSIQFLNCCFNSLTRLPALPSSLSYLWCQYNSLSVLPVLPALTLLECDNNVLTRLPTLSNGLKDLLCFSNSLTVLPTLPASLINLSCQFNLLKSLPVLPDSLKILECYSNALSSLPTLPGKLQKLWCQNNTIRCFPVFPNTISNPAFLDHRWYFYIDIDNNPFTCLPNQLSLQMPARDLTFPICTQDDLKNCPEKTVGVRDSSLENHQIKVYPNPTHGKVSIEFKGGADEKLYAELYDVNGQLVFYKEIKGKTDWDLSFLMEGVYIIIIKTADYSVSKKKVIVN